MELGEKLQQLRKSRGLTQEELAELLFVSRTAISRWESGRGYPGIDSLKEISKLFQVSIDDLLSGERLISIAEREKQESIRGICAMLFALVDLCSVLMILLPLYPKTVGEFVYSVPLFAYTETAVMIRALYWSLFLALTLSGLLKMILLRSGRKKGRRAVTGCAMLLGMAAVLVLALTGQTYAVAVMFLLLVAKGILLFHSGYRYELHRDTSESDL
jgi:transcriptional regulator with XRE-family HTH domain